VRTAGIRFSAREVRPLEESTDSTLLAKVAGFSLHAATVCEAHQRGRLERLCRYITRPPIATKRLSVDAQPLPASTAGLTRCLESHIARKSAARMAAYPSPNPYPTLRETSQPRTSSRQCTLATGNTSFILPIRRNKIKRAITRYPNNCHRS
jgi:hypothetical protein